MDGCRIGVGLMSEDVGPAISIDIVNLFRDEFARRSVKGNCALTHGPNTPAQDVKRDSRFLNHVCSHHNDGFWVAIAIEVKQHRGRRDNTRRP